MLTLGAPSSPGQWSLLVSDRSSHWEMLNPEWVLHVCELREYSTFWFLPMGPGQPCVEAHRTTFLPRWLLRAFFQGIFEPCWLEEGEASTDAFSLLPWWSWMAGLVLWTNSGWKSRNQLKQDIPGGPVTKTLHSQHRGPGFDPRSGN